jgi:hypothetical protein
MACNAFGVPGGGVLGGDAGVGLQSSTELADRGHISQKSCQFDTHSGQLIRGQIQSPSATVIEN